MDTPIEGTPQVGDIIQIKGRLGFLMNPKVKILEIKGGLVKIISADRVDDNDGLLAHMNESWHGIEELLKKQ